MGPAIDDIGIVHLFSITVNLQGVFQSVRILPEVIYHYKIGTEYCIVKIIMPGLGEFQPPKKIINGLPEVHVDCDRIYSETVVSSINRTVCLVVALGTVQHVPHANGTVQIDIGRIIAVHCKIGLTQITVRQHLRMRIPVFFGYRIYFQRITLRFPIIALPHIYRIQLGHRPYIARIIFKKFQQGIGSILGRRLVRRRHKGERHRKHDCGDYNPTEYIVCSGHL